MACAAASDCLRNPSISLTHQVVLLGLAEVTARSERRHRLRSCRRPALPPAQAPAEWWGYVRRCVSHRRRYETVRLDWGELKERRRVRREYVEGQASASAPA